MKYNGKVQYLKCLEIGPETATQIFINQLFVVNALAIKMWHIKVDEAKTK